MKPKLRFSEFTDEWQKASFATTSGCGRYGMNAPAYTYNGLDKYLRITDINEVSHRFGHDNLTSPGGALSSGYLLQKGDFVVARTGASTGKSYLYDSRDGKVYFAGFLIRFRVNNDNDPRFIYSQTLRSNYKKWVEITSARSGQPGINSEEYESYYFEKPSKPEQQKIADFLTTVDEKISLLEQRVEKLETYKRGAMQKIFSQKIRFKDGKFQYSDWEIKKLGQVCDITTGKLDANAMEDCGNYRFYTCAKEYYRINEFAFDTEALLVSGNGANVGYIHYYKGKFNAYQRTYVLDKFKLNIQYVKQFLDDNLSKRINAEKKEGSTPYIVLDTLCDMKINTPKNENEQQKIADFLSSINEKITLSRDKLEKTKEFKKSLLQRMFI